MTAKSKAISNERVQLESLMDTATNSFHENKVQIIGAPPLCPKTGKELSKTDNLCSHYTYTTSGKRLLDRVSISWVYHKVQHSIS